MLVVLAGALLVRFQQMIAPVVLAVIVTYLLRPVVTALTARTRLSWQAAVGVVYLAIIILLVVLLTAAGIAIVQQVQGLYGSVLQIASPNLPARLQRLLSAPVQLGPFLIDLSKPLQIGPFVFDFNHVNWQPQYDQVLNALRPALLRAGDGIRALATTTAATVAWLFFILIFSFYLLFDWQRLAGSLGRAVPPAYTYDAQRLAGALVPIWNAFLRGQITLGIVMGLAVGLTMAALGVRYPLVLGLLGGLLEFVPIVGPVVSGGAAVLIALFQPGNWLDLDPVPYALVVLAAAILIQQLENNFLVPRILGGSLNLHPVVILLGAFVAADLAGIVGLLLSAPVLATLRLIGRYVYRKMQDLDPWPDPPPVTHPVEHSWLKWVRGLF
jgi:predicted PurR-regulated permease PerM